MPPSEADARSNASANAALAGLTFAEIFDKAMVVETVTAGPLACGKILKQR